MESGSINKKNRLSAVWLVEVTGLEPATSASRTQRSTRLNYTSITTICLSQKKYMTTFFLIESQVFLNYFVS